MRYVIRLVEIYETKSIKDSGGAALGCLSSAEFTGFRPD
jgi:hypothetical protein